MVELERPESAIKYGVEETQFARRMTKARIQILIILKTKITS